MPSPATRAALYLRVSTDTQTVENQRVALRAEADRRGCRIVREYEDAGVSGAKGRDKRLGFDALLKDAARRRFDVVLVWSMDRLGRSVLHVALATAELDAAGVALVSLQQGVDGTTPYGRAMMQMASVFAELERSAIKARVAAGLERARQQGVRLGRPRVDDAKEAEVRRHLAMGMGVLRAAKLAGVGSGTAQRIRREMRA
ncbi:recombinase family protein [Falsiroseomonas oryziterrae]|uniref:recombinase family protein n=1 Tax=Falsiroseomonas oryziterrae TaxID=2911368 RepID=UPI001F2B8AFB|nr:recombinase family protein [Roseomonas sp. NPKOSM-4]